MNLRGKALTIINHYGIMPQLKYFQSEVFELNQAIIEYENFNDYSPIDASSIEVDEKIFTIPVYIEHLKSHIAEEIGDVELMLNEFKEYYGINDDEIGEIMNFKADRQLKRIEEDSIEKLY